MFDNRAYTIISGNVYASEHEAYGIPSLDYSYTQLIYKDNKGQLTPLFFQTIKEKWEKKKQ
jgi:hypothetical protein